MLKNFIISVLVPLRTIHIFRSRIIQYGAWWKTKSIKYLLKELNFLIYFTH